MAFEDDSNRWEQFLAELNYLSMYNASFCIKFEMKNGRVSRSTMRIVHYLFVTLKARVDRQVTAA